MRIVTFNINGLRAILQKNFLADLKTLDADIYAFQETKYSDEAFPPLLENYYLYFTNSKNKKGYSGTLVLSKEKPLNVHYGLEEGKYDDEGRVITLEFASFYFVNAYVPNAGENLKRLPYRMQFEEDIRSYMMKLNKIKPVIYCGDLNVAHEEIDLKNPSSNHHNPGFTDEERNKFSKLLNAGFVDVYRHYNPTTIKYSWWSYRFNARVKNAGWRIDYFVISKRIIDRVKNIDIHDEIYGSDHCPVSLEINLD